MLCLELPMLIVGFIFLITGKIHLARKVIDGAAARLIGLVLMLPFVGSFAVGFIDGFMHGLQRRHYNPSDRLEFYAMIEIALLVSSIVLTIIMVAGSNSETEEVAEKYPDDVPVAEPADSSPAEAVTARRKPTARLPAPPPPPPTPPSRLFVALVTIFCALVTTIGLAVAAWKWAEVDSLERQLAKVRRESVQQHSTQESEAAARRRKELEDERQQAQKNAQQSEQALEASKREVQELGTRLQVLQDDARRTALQLEAAGKLESDLQRRVRLFEARQYLEHGRLDDAAASLDACPPSHRGWDWRLLRALAPKPMIAFPPIPGDSGPAIYTADADTFAHQGPSSILIREVATGNEVRQIRIKEGRTSSAFSSDGKKVVTFAGEDASVWSLATGQRLGGARFQGEIGWAAVRPGPQIFPQVLLRDRGLSSEEHGLFVHSLQNGRQMWSVTVPTVAETVYSPDGESLVVSSPYRPGKEPKGGIQFLDPGAGKFVGERIPENGSRVCFSADSKRLAAYNEASRILVFDVKSRKRIGTLDVGGPLLTSNLAFSHDGETLAACRNREMVLWRVRDGQVLRSVPLGKGNSPGMSVSFSPAGDNVLVRRQSGAILVIPLAAPASPFFRTLPNASCLALSRSGDYLAVGNRQGSVKLHHAATGELLATLPPQPGAIVSMVFLPQANRFVTAGMNGSDPEKPALIKLWDLKGKDHKSFAGLTGAPSQLTLSAAADVLTAIGKQRGANRVQVISWRIDTGEIEQNFSVDGTSGLVAHGTGKQLLYAARGVGATGVLVLRDPDVVLPAASLGPLTVLGVQGECMAAGDDSGRLHTWLCPGEASKIRNLPPSKFFIPRAHAGAVTGLVFADSGARLITGGADGRVIVWNTADGSECFTLPGFAGGVTALAVSTDQSRLAMLGTHTDGSSVVRLCEIPAP